MLEWLQNLPSATLMALGALILSAGAYGTNYGRYRALSLGGLILFGGLTIAGGLLWLYGCHYFYIESENKLAYVALAILGAVVFFAANEMGKRHGKRDEENRRR